MQGSLPIDELPSPYIYIVKLQNFRQKTGEGKCESPRKPSGASLEVRRSRRALCDGARGDSFAARERLCCVLSPAMRTLAVGVALAHRN